MAATLVKAKRYDRSRVTHWVLSLKAGERADKSRWETISSSFLETMAAEHLQVVCAVHGDTTNPHLHLVINRVDPATARVIEIGGKLRKIRAQEACARIEHQFGLAAEPNALFTFDGQQLWCNKTGQIARDPAGTWINIKKRENLAEAAMQASAHAPLHAQTRNGGLEHAAVAILQEARSWQEIAERLSAAGMSLAVVTTPKGGRGAQLTLPDGVRIKASRLGRPHSLARLEQRHGRAPAAFENGRGSDPAFAAYRNIVLSQQNSIMRARDEALSELAAQRTAWMSSISTGLPLGVSKQILSAINAEFSAAASELRGVFGASLSELSNHRLSLADWHSRGRPAPPQVEIPRVVVPAGLEAAGPKFPPSLEIVGESHFVRTLALRNHPDALLTDARVVLIWRDPALDEVALKMAADRWGEIAVTASHKTLRRLRPIAQRHGIDMRERPSDPPDLHARIASAISALKVPMPAGSVSPAPKKVRVNDLARRTGAGFPIRHKRPDEAQSSVSSTARSLGHVPKPFLQDAPVQSFVSNSVTPERQSARSSNFSRTPEGNGVSKASPDVGETLAQVKLQETLDSEAEAAREQRRLQQFHHQRNSRRR